MKKDYYSETLYGERLKRCYDIAPPRVKQYLNVEVEYIVEEIGGTDRVLELGCGYGRVMKLVSPHVRTVVGVDTSGKTLAFAQEYLSRSLNCHIVQMDAAHLGFQSYTFDAVLCIQNGLSAFHVDSKLVVNEAIRVTRPNGVILFSSYSPKFWKHRLEWFRLQSAEGLVGEIDESKTGEGLIVCKDGFRTTLVREHQFRKLFTSERMEVSIVEVDESSVFARVKVL